MINAVKRTLHSLKCFSYYNWKITDVPYPPRYLQIETTSHCNLKCPMCFHSFKAKKRVDGYMSLALYRKIIDEVKDYIFRVSLHHRGEPLLHSQLGTMIKMASERGVKTNIHTNATLLTKKKSEELLESGLDEMHFSFDGEDKNTFEKMRRPANYERTLENIVNFLKLKKKYKTSKPRVEIQVLKPYTSIRESNKGLRHIFRGLPVDVFSTGILFNSGGDFKKEIETKIVTPRSSYAPCNTIWSDAVIDWDGKVPACCRDYDNDYVLGNVKDAPFLEIWNNEKMRDLRKRLIERRYKEIDLCRDCDALWTLKYEQGLSKKILARFVRLLRIMREND